MAKHSVAQIREAAESSVLARTKADAAKKAWEEAKGTDDESRLKAEYDAAESAAVTAKATADALSQEDTAPDPKRVAKLKKKRGIIERELQSLGVDDDDDDDEDDEEDESRPVTHGDLRRMEAEKATKEALEMAQGIQDPTLRAAVIEALSKVVPSGNPAEDFKAAAAIANIARNDRVLEEIARRPAPNQHRNGAGAPARQVSNDDFVPTREEAAMMESFGLTKEDVLKARQDSGTGSGQ